MTRVALKGLWGRKLRTVLTAMAIVLGVSMISGTYVLTDTITASFTQVVEGSYETADAVRLEALADGVPRGVHLHRPSGTRCLRDDERLAIRP